MLPGALIRLQSKRSTKTGNPLQSLHQSNSRIAKSASMLPPCKGTVSCADFIRKHKYAYQAHLQRVSHFLVQGKGVWCHEVWMAVCIFMMAMMTLSSLIQVQNCCTFAILTWRTYQDAQGAAGSERGISLPTQARYTWKQQKNGRFNTYLSSAVSLSR